MTKFFGLLVLGAACAVAQTVEGNVVNSATGTGIAAVEVRILQNGKALHALTTDARGHFLVEGVKEGTYELHCYSPDFWPSGPGSVGRFAVQTFQVSGVGNPVNLEARLTPAPTLSGRVVDGRGEGVPRARVQLSASGLPTSYGTDPDGTFYVHDLRPGAYTLWVTPPVGLKPPAPEPDSGRVLGWTRTFYPGVAIPEAAAKIVLGPGVVQDVALKLLAVPARLVRGVLLKPDGTPAPNVDIDLAEGPSGPPTLSVETKSDGTFEFPAVVDGEWRLFAEAQSGDVDLQATQWIEMTGHEIEGVKLRLSPPFTVRVQVVMETPQGIPAPEPPTVSLSGRISGMYATDGSLSIEGVYPGVYTINGAEPQGYYLDSVRMGETEVTSREVEFSGPTSITLLYKTNGGTVRGTVENCVSGTVVLVPQGTGPSAGFSRGTCDSNGRYEITAVRPGEYYVLAFPGDNPTVPLSDSLLKQATSVTVGAGETCSANLHAITRYPP